MECISSSFQPCVDVIQLVTLAKLKIFFDEIHVIMYHYIMWYCRHTSKMANASVDSSSRVIWWTKCIYFMLLLDFLYFMPHHVLASLFYTAWLLSVCERENKIPSLNPTGKLQGICITNNSYPWICSYSRFFGFVFDSIYMWCATTLSPLPRWNYGRLCRGVGWVQREACLL